jgi:hypothetical protein
MCHRSQDASFKAHQVKVRTSCALSLHGQLPFHLLLSRLQLQMAQQASAGAWQCPSCNRVCGARFLACIGCKYNRQPGEFIIQQGASSAAARAGALADGEGSGAATGGAAAASGAAAAAAAAAGAKGESKYGKSAAGGGKASYSYGSGASASCASFVPPLPDGWVELLDKATGRTFYWNRQTNKTQWERPMPAEASEAGAGEDGKHGAAAGSASQLLLAPKAAHQRKGSSMFSPVLSSVRSGPGGAARRADGGHGHDADGEHSDDEDEAQDAKLEAEREAKRLKGQLDSISLSPWHVSTVVLHFVCCVLPSRRY